MKFKQLVILCFLTTVFISCEKDKLEPEVSTEIRSSVVQKLNGTTLSPEISWNSLSSSDRDRWENFKKVSSSKIKNFKEQLLKVKNYDFDKEVGKANLKQPIYILPSDNSMILLYPIYKEDSFEKFIVNYSDPLDNRHISFLISEENITDKDLNLNFVWQNAFLQLLRAYKSGYTSSKNNACFLEVECDLCASGYGLTLGTCPCINGGSGSNPYPFFTGLPGAGIDNGNGRGNGGGWQADESSGTITVDDAYLSILMEVEYLVYATQNGFDINFSEFINIVGLSCFNVDSNYGFYNVELDYACISTVDPNFELALQQHQTLTNVYSTYAEENLDIGLFLQQNGTENYLHVATIFETLQQEGGFDPEDLEEFQFYLEMVWASFSELLDLAVTFVPYGIGDAADIYQSCGEAGWSCAFAIFGAFVPFDEVYSIVKNSEKFRAAWRTAQSSLHLIKSWKSLYSKPIWRVNTNYLNKVTRYSDEGLELFEESGDIIVKQADGTKVGKLDPNDPYNPGEMKVQGDISGRHFDPDNAGGPIIKSSWQNPTISQDGIDDITTHLERFGNVPDNTNMIQRLNQIKNGEIPITDYDKRFYTHELEEYSRYKNLNVADGANPPGVWDNAHAASLEVYSINEAIDPLYHP